MKEILLITPPFTQLNTPYPATAYLKGFLNTKSISSFQMDLGIEVILEVFSKKGLKQLFKYSESDNNNYSSNSNRILAVQDSYIETVDTVIDFLKGKKATTARLINSFNYLPQASRFNSLDDIEWAFGKMGIQDQAKHLATLYLEDISDFIVECVDENFGFSRYAEKLGRSANSFEELNEKLKNEPSYIDSISLQILDKKLKEISPKLICFSVPFPGNLYAAFKCAQYIKTHFPTIKIAMGGGFPNTELRSLKDNRVFNFFDYITLDDGELPIELLYKNLQEKSTYKRTYLLENNIVEYKNDSTLTDYKQAEVGTPDYTNLPLSEYISVIEVANPMHSLWTDGRWNKLTMAHGCYWAKCSFCDVSLDYIKLYEPFTAKLLVDRIEEIISTTAESGFHFVDEAAPPALMRELALEIIRRKISITWWTNIRFEKSFSADLCKLLAASGCIAVSGGLEVASDRLLKLIEKGVTVEQVAKVTRNLTEAGIMVHAYLMYGYPTQTEQETVDSLEMVRQLFELGIVQSGFWHQFALTAHSPIGLNPSKYDISPILEKIEFADNDINFKDKTGIDHSKFNQGLKTSLYNFMNEAGFDLPLKDWFNFKIPSTTIAPNYIENCLLETLNFKINPNHKVIWLNALPTLKETKKTIELHVRTLQKSFKIKIEKAKAEWLILELEKANVHQKSTTSLGNLKASYEKLFDEFEPFWFSKPIQKLKNNGLLVI